MLLSDLILKVRRRAKLELSSNITSSEDRITDDEITDYINEGAAYIHQTLALADEDFAITKVLITIAAPIVELSLPSDFLFFRRLDKQFTADGYSKMHPFDPENASLNTHGDFDFFCYYEAVPRYSLLPSSIELLPKTLSAGTYLLRYVPQFQDLVSPSDSLSNPEHWNDFIITFAAIQCLVVLSLSADDLRVELARNEKMLMQGSLSRGQPRVMANVRRRRIR